MNMNRLRWETLPVFAFGLVLLLVPSSAAFAQTPEPTKPETTEVEQSKKRLQQLEYWGPNGMVFFRNVQFRWMPLKGRNSVTIALERPGASGDQGRFEDRIELSGIRPKFDLPDLSGNVRFTRSWGYFQAAGMLRRIKSVDTVDDAFDLGGTVGAGVNLTSNLKFGEKDTGRFAFVFGQGIENYMNDADVDVGIELTPGGDPRRPIKGVALPMWSMVAFLDHNWNKKFSTAIGYSFMDVDNSDGQAPDAYHRGHYAVGNLLYYPVDRVMVGGELQWAGARTSSTASSRTISASSFPLSTTSRSCSHFDL